VHPPTSAGQAHPPRLGSRRQLPDPDPVRSSWRTGPIGVKVRQVVTCPVPPIASLVAVGSG
jgi:hypothetical protein